MSCHQSFLSCWSSWHTYNGQLVCIVLEMTHFLYVIYRYHHLKLYPEDESGPQSIKKPVVVESYDEIVFSEPSEAFYARIQNHLAAIVPRLPPTISLPPPGNSYSSFFKFHCLPCLCIFSKHWWAFVFSAVLIENSSEKKRGDTKDHALSQWFMNFSEADELSKLAAARQQVRM